MKNLIPEHDCAKIIEKNVILILRGAKPKILWLFLHYLGLQRVNCSQSRCTNHFKIAKQVSLGVLQHPTKFRLNILGG